MLVVRGVCEREIREIINIVVLRCLGKLRALAYSQIAMEYLSERSGGIKTLNLSDDLNIRY